MRRTKLAWRGWFERSGALVTVVVSVAACSGSTDGPGGSGATGGTSTGGTTGSSTGGTAGSSSGGTTGSSAGGTMGSSTGGTTGSSTGGTTGSSTGGTSTGGTGGTISTECGQLKVDYAAKLAIAKRCTIFGGSPDCSVLVDDGLECPCKTFAEKLNTTLIAELASLREEWLDKGCDELVDCSGNAGCAMATSATCDPSGQGGDAAVCKDKR